MKTTNMDSIATEDLISRLDQRAITRGFIKVLDPENPLKPFRGRGWVGTFTDPHGFWGDLKDAYKSLDRLATWDAYRLDGHYYRSSGREIARIATTIFDLFVSKDGAVTFARLGQQDGIWHLPSAISEYYQSLTVVQRKTEARRLRDKTKNLLAFRHDAIEKLDPFPYKQSKAAFRAVVAEIAQLLMKVSRHRIRTTVKRGEWVKCTPEDSPLIPQLNRLIQSIDDSTASLTAGNASRRNNQKLTDTEINYFEAVAALFALLVDTVNAGGRYKVTVTKANGDQS